MSDGSARTLDRLGACAGFATVALLVAVLMFFPALPAADEPITSIAGEAARNANAILWGAYAGALLGAALLAFGAILSARLRVAEGAGGGWWILALAGVTAASCFGAVSDLMNVVFVRAVGHGLAGDGLWTAYGGDLVGFFQGAPLAVFLLGAGMGIRATGAFPRWTGIVALAASALFIVGTGSVAGREVDGGPLVFPLMLA
jgi:hypothetical protein